MYDPAEAEAYSDKEHNKMSFEEFKKMLLFRNVVEWTENSITLDNGIQIAIEEIDSD